MNDSGWVLGDGTPWSLTSTDDVDSSKGGLGTHISEQLETLSAREFIPNQQNREFLSQRGPAGWMGKKCWMEKRCWLTPQGAGPGEGAAGFHPGTPKRQQRNLTPAGLDFFGYNFEVKLPHPKNSQIRHFGHFCPLQKCRHFAGKNVSSHPAFLGWPNFIWYPPPPRGQHG